MLAELSRRGYDTVAEPGRRIVADEMRACGTALPWVDLAAFAERAIELAALDRALPSTSASWTFFDRGLVDAAVAMQRATGRPATEILNSFEPYHQRVFLTPPWPEIYVSDEERRHSFDEAEAEYDRLVTTYAELGYDTVLLPRVSVPKRATYLLRQLGPA